MSEQTPEATTEQPPVAVTEAQEIQALKDSFSDNPPQIEEVVETEDVEEGPSAFDTLTRKEEEVTALLEESNERLGALQALEEKAGSFSDDPVSFIKAHVDAMVEDGEDPEAAFLAVYEALTMDLIGDDATGEMKEENRYRALEKRLEKSEAEVVRKEQEHQEQQNHNQAMSLEYNALSEVRDNLVADANEYPYLLGQDDDPSKAVWGLIKDDFLYKQSLGDENPELLTVQEAATAIEQELQGVAAHWASLSTKDTSQNTIGRPEYNSPSGRTLTNTNASVAPSRHSEQHVESDDEAARRIKEKYS